MIIQESAEMYLETILKLSENGNPVHSIDIVKELKVTKPSVSVAIKNLRENGYVSMSEDGALSLLPKGLEIANKIYERHKYLTKCLQALGITPQVAEDDACRIEHIISDETFTKIKEYVEKNLS